MRTAAQNAELALLLEVTGTPKPGNVDRHRDFPDLRFEHFLAGAVGAQRGLRAAEDGERVGKSFERAVRGMAEQEGGNTQFGALLLLVPLVRTAATRALSSDTVTDVVEATSVADAADFYRAFEHVAVAVDDPPDGLEPLDVRQGSAAIPTLEERELTLYDVMELSAPVDGIAREWTAGFARSFDAADRLIDLGGPLPDRTARVFLELLAAEADTFIAKQHDEASAKRVRDEAREVLDAVETEGSLDAAEPFADELVAAGLNPGTTADIAAAALCIVLERDRVSV